MRQPWSAPHYLCVKHSLEKGFYHSIEINKVIFIVFGARLDGDHFDIEQFGDFFARRFGLIGLLDDGFGRQGFERRAQLSDVAGTRCDPGFGLDGADLIEFEPLVQIDHGVVVGDDLARIE